MTDRSKKINNLKDLLKVSSGLNSGEEKNKINEEKMQWLAEAMDSAEGNSPESIVKRMKNVLVFQIKNTPEDTEGITTQIKDLTEWCYDYDLANVFLDEEGYVCVVDAVKLFREKNESNILKHLLILVSVCLRNNLTCQNKMLSKTDMVELIGSFLTDRKALLESSFKLLGAYVSGNAETMAQAFTNFEILDSIKNVNLLENKRHFFLYCRMLYNALVAEFPRSFELFTDNVSFVFNKLVEDSRNFVKLYNFEELEAMHSLFTRYLEMARSYENKSELINKINKNKETINNYYKFIHKNPEKDTTI